jgi:type IV secretory pathway VirB4 component
MESSVKANAKATQQFVPIKEVRDGVVILKDGSLRTLVMTSSLNFALKSADEQTAIIAQFQNFLNSLNFSVQICIQSRRLDIRPYIALLQERQKAQTSDLMKLQTREYIEFIKSFTDSTNIMTKTFFIVVPYVSATLNTKGSKGIGGIFSKKSKVDKKAAADESFEQARSQLEERVSVVEDGLTRCGIRVVELGTEELVELFYKIFNPGDSEKPIIQADAK